MKIYKTDYKRIVDILRKYPHNLTKGFREVAEKFSTTENYIRHFYYYNKKFKEFIKDYPVVEVISGNHKLMMRNNKNQIITSNYQTNVCFFTLSKVKYTIKK